jgi:hypothetical protein
VGDKQPDILSIFLIMADNAGWFPFGAHQGRVVSANSP